MSDPFEAMRIPREQSPSAPQPHGSHQPRHGRPVSGSAPLPGPSDDPFEQMRIRPEAFQQPGARAEETPPKSAAQQGVPQSKGLLADVPNLRTYSGSATLGVRFFAKLIDIVIVALIAAGLWFLLAYLLRGKLVLDLSVTGYLAFALAFVALNLLYEVVCARFGGSTIGRAVFKLRVVQYNTGEVMDTNTSIVRQILPSAALLVPFAGIVLAPLTYLSALWDPTRLKRDWSDRFTETTWVRRV